MSLFNKLFAGSLFRSRNKLTTSLRAAKGSGKTIPTVSGKIFSNPDTSYRVIVGDAAFDDIVTSGLVRTNAGSKPLIPGKVNLGHRPTAFPSFAKGEAAMSYANSNPNHYIITSKSPSIKPSTAGRHGFGSTHFPTDESGKHLVSMPASEVKVYKHVGNSQYELAYLHGKKMQTSPTLGLGIAIHKKATGNAVTRRLPGLGRPVRTVNRSRHLGFNK